MSLRAQNDAGFTLVEALVSLFVFSLIAAGCVAMLMQSVESQRRINAAHEHLRELQTTRALLASDLTQLVMREVRGQNGARRPRFIGGDADTPLAFVRASAEPQQTLAAAATLSMVEYRFTGTELIRASSNALEAGGVLSERVVMSNLSAARFEFFDGASWRDAWIVGAAGGAPPRAVALVVQSARYGEVRLQAIVGLGS